MRSEGREEHLGEVEAGGYREVRRIAARKQEMERVRRGACQIYVILGCSLLSGGPDVAEEEVPLQPISQADLRRRVGGNESQDLFLT